MNINLKLLVIHESCFVFFEKPGVESDQLHITTGCGVIMSPHLLPVLGRYLTDTLVYVNTQRSNLFLQCLKSFKISYFIYFCLAHILSSLVMPTHDTACLILTKLQQTTFKIFYFYLSKKIRLERIHLKHQVLFSLKNNEKIFMNFVCCRCDWHF